MSLQVNTIYWSSWYAFITTWSLHFNFRIFKLGVEALKNFLTETKWNAMGKNKLLKRHRELKKVVTSFQLYRELEHIVVTGYFQENLFPDDMFLWPNLW